MAGELPNSSRNLEVSLAITHAKTADVSQSPKHVGVASATASLDIAESLQLLQLQLSEFSSEIRSAIEKNSQDLIKSNEKLLESNERNASVASWLAGALVFFTAVQAIAIIIQVYLLLRN